MGIFLMSINIDFNNHVKCCIGFYPIGIPKCILLRLCCWSFRAVPIFQYHTPPPKGSAYLKRSPETELMKNTSQNHHPQRPAQRPPGKPSLLSGAPETAGRLEGRKLKILAVLPGTAQRKTANVSVNVTSFWLPGGEHSSWKEWTMSMFQIHHHQRGQLILNAPLKQNWWRIRLRITTLRGQPRGHQENLLCSFSSPQFRSHQARKGHSPRAALSIIRCCLLQPALCRCIFLFPKQGY